MTFSFSFCLCSLSNNNLLTDVWLRPYCTALFISLVEGFLAGALSEGVDDTLVSVFSKHTHLSISDVFSMSTIVAVEALMKPDGPCIISLERNENTLFLDPG